jgi:hypothetical protein
MIWSKTSFCGTFLVPAPKIWPSDRGMIRALVVVSQRCGRTSQRTYWSSIGTGWYKFLSWNMVHQCSSCCFFKTPNFFHASAWKNMGILTWNNLETTQKKKTRVSPSPCARGLGLIIRRPSLRKLDPPWRYEWSLKHWSQEFGTISWIIPVFFCLWWFWH